MCSIWTVGQKSLGKNSENWSYTYFTHLFAFNTGTKISTEAVYIWTKIVILKNPIPTAGQFYCWQTYSCNFEQFDNVPDSIQCVLNLFHFSIRQSHYSVYLNFTGRLFWHTPRNPKLKQNDLLIKKKIDVELPGA